MYLVHKVSGGDIGPVKPAHMHLVMTRIFFKVLLKT